MIVLGGLMRSIEDEIMMHDNDVKDDVGEL